MGTVPHEAADTFEAHRRHLLGLAYRMLGSVADAEDVVQDAFIRWLGADRASVHEPAAFLRRTVTRRCAWRRASKSQSSTAACTARR